MRERWRVGWNSLAQLHNRLFWPNSKAIKAAREMNIRYQQRWRRWGKEQEKAFYDFIREASFKGSISAGKHRAEAGIWSITKIRLGVPNANATVPGRECWNTNQERKQNLKFPRLPFLLPLKNHISLNSKAF